MTKWIVFLLFNMTSCGISPFDHSSEIASKHRSPKRESQPSVHLRYAREVLSKRYDFHRIVISILKAATPEDRDIYLKIVDGRILSRHVNDFKLKDLKQLFPGINPGQKEQDFLALLWGAYDVPFDAPERHFNAIRARRYESIIPKIGSVRDYNEPAVQWLRALPRDVIRVVLDLIIPYGQTHLPRALRYNKESYKTHARRRLVFVTRLLKQPPVTQTRIDALIELSPYAQRRLIGNDLARLSALATFMQGTTDFANADAFFAAAIRQLSASKSMLEEVHRIASGKWLRYLRNVESMPSSTDFFADFAAIHGISRRDAVLSFQEDILIPYLSAKMWQ